MWVTEKTSTTISREYSKFQHLTLIRLSSSIPSDRERGFKSRPRDLIFINENQGLPEYKMNTAKVITMLNSLFMENNS